MIGKRQSVFSSRYHRTPATALLLAALSLTAAVVASGASAATVGADPGSAGQLSFEAVDQSEGYFDLVMEPGESRTVSVELGNTGLAPVLTRTYAADALSLVNGGFGAEGREGEPSEVTRWLTYPTDVGELAAGSTRTRSFSVTVPAESPPGQYISSVILENETATEEAANASLAQIMRHAIPVAIRIPGAEEPSFSVGEAGHAIAANQSTVFVTVTNTGNVHLKPAGSWIIRDGDGRAVAETEVTMNSVFAGTSARGETTLQDTLPPGLYTVDVAMTDETTGAAVSTSLLFTVADSSAEVSARGGTSDGGVLQQVPGGAVPYALAAVVGMACLATWLVVRHLGGRRRAANSTG